MPKDLPYWELYEFSGEAGYGIEGTNFWYEGYKYRKSDFSLSFDSVTPQLI